MLILMLGFSPLALLVVAVGLVRVLRGRRRRRWKKAGRFVLPDCLPCVVWLGLALLGLVSCRGEEVRTQAEDTAALWTVGLAVAGTCGALLLWSLLEIVFSPPRSRVVAKETRMQRIERYRRERQEAYLDGLESGVEGNKSDAAQRVPTRGEWRGSTSSEEGQAA